MKIINKTITILLIIAIGLLLVDLFTGIWYWNRLNLKFDLANYNYVVSPTFAIFATIIYGLALFNAIKQNRIILSQSIEQNRIILSQNIKPHYEREIENLISQSSKSL